MVASSQDGNAENQGEPNSRRSFIRNGVIAGAAGLLGAAVPLQRAEPFVVAPSGLSRNMDENMTLLMDEGAIEPYSSVDFFYVPPNASVTVRKAVPLGMAFVVKEDRITVGQDHAMQLTAHIDGQLALSDPDLVQSRYNRPFLLVGPASMYAIRDRLTMKISNRTPRTTYFSLMQSGAKMPGLQWDSLLAAMRKRP